MLLIIWCYFQIPHGKSAILVVQAIRERFFSGYREAEFVVVCDVKKENPTIIQELNDAQVLRFCLVCYVKYLHVMLIIGLLFYLHILI